MRTLATNRELAALRGDADNVEHPEDYRRKVRYRIRNRIDRLETELDELEDLEPELAQSLRARICPRDEEIADQMQTVLDEMQALGELLAERDTDRPIPDSVMGDLLRAKQESIDVDELRRELKDDSGGDNA